MTNKKEESNNIRFAALATDVVLFTIEEDTLHVLLTPVNTPPFFVNEKGLPGGLLKPSETAREAAERILKQKGGVDFRRTYLEQLYTFSAVSRDPRNRVVSVAYLGLVPAHKKAIEPEAQAYWAPVDKALTTTLAYDHNDILATGVGRLQSKLEYTNIAQFLLPKSFTLTELQDLYEIIRKEKLDKRNFRRKVREAGMVKKTGRKRRGEANRPADLYTFTNQKLKEIEIL